MTETLIISNKVNHLIDPQLSIWGWEVPVYLFLGGLAAGALVVSSLVILFGKEEQYKNATGRLIFWGLLFLSVGMGALFLDLEYKVHVWRFYTAFELKSPMSWGSWILMIFYPVSFLLMIATSKTSFSQLRARLGVFDGEGVFAKATQWCELKKNTLAKVGVVTGASLGGYTGVLLSANSARPFWNSSILGVLFLVSGLSTLIAFHLLFVRNHEEHRVFARIDMGLIVFELALLGFWVLGFLNGSEISQRAGHAIMGGNYTELFWIFVVGLGLLTPLVMEWLEERGRKIPVVLTSLLILCGGLALRILMVYAGQETGWITY
ncbi:MAG: polysulfide reductase NrfD [Bdellovibrionales bacterium]|nr:polysulfide reductase NrfD [Bdellovibrionales bacterium]